MKRKMFCSARSESDFMEHFKENEIYRFCDIAEEKLASTPVLVRRAASFNERYSLGGPNKVEFSQREHKMMPGRFVIPSKMSTSPLAKSRRLSSSHGNLPSMVSPRMFNSTETVISTKVEVDYNLKETEEEEERNLSGRIRQAEKIVDRDSNLVQVTTKPTVGLPPNVVSVANIRTFGKLVQSNTPVSNEERIVRTEQQKEDSTGAVKRNSPVRVVRCPLTECDVCDVWKDAVLSRLRTLLGVASLRGIFEFEFSGYDVKWNCEKVGRRGIVYVKEEDDTLSTYLIAMMRYLSQWPFDRKFADKQYDGFELNVFENVCEHFAKGCPLLPTLLALAILNIVEVIRKRNTAAPMVVSPLIGTDSMPADDVSPLTRYATYSNSVEGQTPSALQVNTEATPRAFMRASHARNSAAATQSRRPIHPRLEDGSSRASVMSPFALPTESTTSESSRIKLKEYESVLARLPGLHHSPELLERMRELATAVKTPPLRVTSISSSSLFKTPKLGLSPLVAGIAREDESDLIWCVALILLTIPPPTRRRLHFLVRFMQRVCKNHCLHLDTHRENRYVVSCFPITGVTGVEI
ncbi:unnamed protein product [Toxocara canis]|uniref:Flocculation protein FLO11-like n=1 Tax=Toxocara canis TaxID=6265 RepID=A0A183V909_TOXCA|nr:unnamed protein product [Toxocara canis]